MCGNIRLVEKKFFNQALFMARVDARRKELRFRKKEVAVAVGLDGVAYSEWLSGVRGMSVDTAVGICEKIDLKPAWAMFDEGPKTEIEAENLDGVRGVIALLSIDARRAVAPAQYVPSPVLMSEVEAVGKELGRVLSNLEEELPEPALLALESVSTLLRRISAPQVAVCRNVQLPVDSAPSQGGAPSAE